MEAITKPRVIFTVKDVAKMLHCSSAHVFNILNGKVPGLPPLAHLALGRRKLILSDSLDAWLEAVTR